MSSEPVTRKAGTFVQWKGTNVCMDFWCECGVSSHVCDFFAYYVQCPTCGAVYKMPEDVKPQRLGPDDPPPHIEPRVGELD